MSAAQPLPTAKLRRAMVARGLTCSGLAREATVGVNTVSRALAGRPISLGVALRISIALAQRPVVEGVAPVLEELSA